MLVSSISADRGLPGPKAAYSASKAGVSALGEALTAELAKSPIVVTTLLPGYIATDMSSKAGDSSALTATLDDGVDAMVSAIEKETNRAALPGIKCGESTSRCGSFLMRGHPGSCRTDL